MAVSKQEKEILEEYQQLIEQITEGTKKLTSAIKKDLVKAHKSYQNAIIKTRGEQAKLRKEYSEALEKGNRIEIDLLNKKLHNLNMEQSSYKENSKLAKHYSEQQNSVSRAVKRQTEIIKQQISVMGALSLAWKGLTSVWDFWLTKEKALQDASRQMVQRTGATGNSLNQLNRETRQLADTLGALSGDPIRAIGEANEAMSELHLSLRRGADQIDQEMLNQLVRLKTGLNLSADEAAAFGMSIRSDFGPGSSVEEAFENIGNLADDIGANAGQLTRDFIGARKNIAQFGRDGAIAFRNAALMATEFQVEAREIFDIASQFDTFEKASESVNMLNSMMGTSISSFELMMEQDPAARIEMLREQIRGAGLEWNNMDRQQRQALSRITGQDEDALARIFGDGRSLQELEQQRRKAAANREEEQRIQGDNQRRLNVLFSEANRYFQSWTQWLNRVKDAVADIVDPLFEEIHGFASNIAEEFISWLKNSEEGKQLVIDIRDAIRGWANQIKQIKWEDVKNTFKDVWQASKGIWEVLKPIFAFMVENPRLTAAFFGVGALILFAAKMAPIMSAFMSLAGLIGPSGVITAGMSSLVAGLAGAAVPAAALVGSYMAAQAAEERRNEEGARVAAGDVSTRRQLSGTALETLRSRADLFSSGRTELAMQGVGSRGAEAQVLNLLEGIGVHSGQEADQKRNNLEYLINDYIKGGIRPGDAIRNLRQILPPEMISTLTRGTGKSFEDYIMSLYRQDPHLSSMFAGSLNVNAPNTSSASIPVASATETSAPVSQSTAQSPTKEIASSNTQAQVTMANVYLDSALVGRAQANLAIGGRTA